MNIPRLFSSPAHVLGALAIFSAVATTACASAPPTEPVGTDVAALCAGSGGGDECVAADGYCPASCGVCFQSVQQRIEMRNLWMCEAAGEGGGGGGGAWAICSDVSQRMSGEVSDDYTSAYASLERAAQAFCNGVDQGDRSCRVTSTRIDVDFESGWDCFRPVGGGRICFGQVTCRRTNR